MTILSRLQFGGLMAAACSLSITTNMCLAGPPSNAFSESAKKVAEIIKIHLPEKVLEKFFPADCSQWNIETRSYTKFIQSVKVGNPSEMTPDSKVTLVLQVKRFGYYHDVIIHVMRDTNGNSERIGEFLFSDKRYLNVPKANPHDRDSVPLYDRFVAVDFAIHCIEGTMKGIGYDDLSKSFTGPKFEGSHTTVCTNCNTVISRL